MFESVLVMAIYLTGVLIPVLIPTTVHAVHFFRDWRTYRPVRRLPTVRVPRPVVSRRVAVRAKG